MGLADRVYAFIAPKIVGGSGAVTPIGGEGSDLISEGWQLEQAEYKLLGPDLMITGLVPQSE